MSNQRATADSGMIGSNQLVSIASDARPDIAEVGGKGVSLIHLSQGGFNVPPGYILTVEFFKQWNQQLAASVQWQQMLQTSPDDLSEFTKSCDRLKAFANTLEFSVEQIEAIQQSVDTNKSYAVRSSSPEEDLADSSFAGLYETLLDVSVDNLLDAVRSCYLSCVDARVFIYKHKLGMAFDSPHIAVVVQELVQSDVAGVAFSLNPINNDFDEALINSSFGLGEALVSGEITPDSWTVNKVSHEVIKFTLGDKGGNQSDKASLNDNQIKSLSQATCRVEEYYQQPMDIEWAFYQDELYFLQARPITTYIPITSEMMTEPGEKRILYMDESLADGITISGPVSTITSNYLIYIFDILFNHLDNRLTLFLPPKDTLMFSTGVRIYTNVTNMGRWRNLAQLGELKKIIDITYADILLTCDLDPYKIKKANLLERLKLTPLVVKTLWSLRLTITSTLKAIFRSEKFHQHYEERLTVFDEFLNEPLPTHLSIHEFLLHYFIPLGEVSQATTAPALGLFAWRGTGALNKLIDDESEQQKQLVESIKSGSDDMVMIMGLKIYELSTLLEPSAFDDLEGLAEQIKARSVDANFLSYWDQFIHDFGCRGPLEMDLAQPKYADDPLVVLRQIAPIVKSERDFDPRVNHKLLKEKRHEAYNELLELLPKKKQKKLIKAYQYICDFEHSREIPKDHLVTFQKRFREYLLNLAKIWLDANRLDSIDQIFDFRVDEILNAQQDESVDLREILANRDPYLARAKRVRHFPHAIDSRGRILRPVREQVPGQLTGSPVSSGIVTGPVKVMHDPFEKELKKGEILVAYTTDPGWTPLFINAEAVLLEVGGELQHGALVAREYGKPCVAGIVNVTHELEDGQMVEVNGNSGSVRLL
ncbi:MAG: hypothetical protein GKR91_09560 [Pseudomonadales bacterium]|nr:hypothetical protein [Pseudomonadales bacterium]